MLTTTTVASHLFRNMTPSEEVDECVSNAPVNVQEIAPGRLSGNETKALDSWPLDEMQRQLRQSCCLLSSQREAWTSPATNIVSEHRIPERPS